MSATVEIVAVGARTPVGLNAESSAAAVRAGISSRGEFPYCDPLGEPLMIAADTQIDPALEGRDRFELLLKSVLAEVHGKLSQVGAVAERVHILLALPEARPGFSEHDAAWIVELLRTDVGSMGQQVRVDLAGRGHAGVIRAVELAKHECIAQTYDLYVIVGIDSYVHSDTFTWLERERRFKQPSIRNGFVPGEAAGCLVLARPEVRRRLHLPRLALLRGVSTAQETRLRDSETGSFGVGMTQAVEAAVAGLSLPREGIDVLYADLNGERYRSEEWGFVALRAPFVWKSLVYEAPADCWGDTGAAFGALAGVLVVQSFARRYARGPRAMVMAGSDGGLRGVMVLEDPGLSS